MFPRGYLGSLALQFAAGLAGDLQLDRAAAQGRTRGASAGGGGDGDGAVAGGAGTWGWNRRGVLATFLEENRGKIMGKTLELMGNIWEIGWFFMRIARRKSLT